MTNLPILFSLREKIECEGFFALVEIDARTVAKFGEDSDGGWWLYGVNPGGCAARGATVPAAVIAMKAEIKNVLEDLADDAGPSFDRFRDGVLSFFDETDDATVAEWDAARAAVRSGGELPEHLRKEPSVKTGARVERIESPTAKRDPIDETPAAAA